MALQVNTEFINNWLWTITPLTALAHNHDFETVSKRGLEKRTQLNARTSDLSTQNLYQGQVCTERVYLAQKLWKSVPGLCYLINARKIYISGSSGSLWHSSPKYNRSDVNHFYMVQVSSLEQIKVLSFWNFLLLSQILPSHSPCENEAGCSQPCSQVENAINTLGVSDQYTRKIFSRNKASKSSSPNDNDTLSIDRRCVFWEEISKTIAEYSFCETEEQGCSKRLAERDERHGDRDLLRWHCILNRDNWLPKKDKYYSVGTRFKWWGISSIPFAIRDHDQPRRGSGIQSTCPLGY